MKNRIVGTKSKVALISVTQKEGIEDFARRIWQEGYTILASGRTYKHLVDNDVPAVSIDRYLLESNKHRLTNANRGQVWWRRLWSTSIEWASSVLCTAIMLGHRIAAGLHPQVEGGLLATPEMAEELEQLGMVRIDLLCVDFYALEQAIMKNINNLPAILQEWDIGGPTMTKAAVKGQRIVVCDPAEQRKFRIDLVK